MREVVVPGQSESTQIGKCVIAVQHDTVDVKCTTVSANGILEIVVTKIGGESTSPAAASSWLVEVTGGMGSLAGLNK
jgi:hypothetical protein